MKKLMKLGLTILVVAGMTACSSASEYEDRPEMQQMQGGGGRMSQSQGGMQGGGMQMQHPEFEKISEEDFYAGLNLSSDVKSQVKVILDEFGETLESKLKGSNRPPQREEMEELISARDKKIKPLLTDAQYTTYKETVEGLFVPDQSQRPMGRM